MNWEAQTSARTLVAMVALLPAQCVSGKPVAAIGASETLYQMSLWSARQAQQKSNPHPPGGAHLQAKIR